VQNLWVDECYVILYLPHMLIEAIRITLQDGIETLREELLKYESEEDLWIECEGIKNPGGNLVLHLCGNIQHYVGTVLGHNPYVRDRAAEFSQKDISKNDLLLELAGADRMVGKVLNILNESDLIEPYPDPSFGEDKTTFDVLLILISHFSYHLGQINYHRRILSKKAVTDA
jgi:hypothetical protein